MASLDSDLSLRRIKYSPRKKTQRWLRPSTFSSLSEPTEAAVKEPTKAELYKNYVKSVQLEFGESSTKYTVFKKLIQDCKKHRITVFDIEPRMHDLFLNHPVLFIGFCDFVLPYLYPMSKRADVNRANRFIESVEVAFPNDPDTWYSVVNLIQRFRNGYASLEYMSGKMWVLLQNRNDLRSGYINLIPEAEHFMHQNGIGNASRSTSTRSLITSFMTYVCAIVVAIGIGIHTLKK